MEFIEETKIVIKEFRTVEGKVQLELSIDLDGEKTNKVATTGFIVAATIFRMWEEGTILHRMQEFYDTPIGYVEHKELETVHGSNPDA